MKIENLALLGILGFAVYKASQNGGSAPAPSFTEGAVATPTGITPALIVEAKNAGLNNAEIVNAFTNGSVAYQVKTSSGGSRTLVTAPKGSTKTSLNGNQYLAPRSGGGYKVVGAKNIKLNS